MFNVFLTFGLVWAVLDFYLAPFKLFFLKFTSSSSCVTSCNTSIKWSNYNKWSWVNAMHVDRNIQTCTILLMTIGSMLRGKRRMLKSARDTKALWASSTLCLSISTYTVNVDKATYSKMETKAERSEGSGCVECDYILFVFFELVCSTVICRARYFKSELIWQNKSGQEVLLFHIIGNTYLDSWSPS